VKWHESVMYVKMTHFMTKVEVINITQSMPNCIFNFIIVYRVSGNNNNRQILFGQVEQTKLNRKVLYHFINFPNS